MKFELVSNYKPSGDQPKAIEKLISNFSDGKNQQILLGATGTGKTYTMAHVIQKLNKKTLVLAHNKTLAGQLYAEFKELFPNNKVEYFVSYYDYYQPEAYVVKSDTYIEKDASINDEIDELRHAATASLLKGDDVIVVASVSCIYGIGEVEEYLNKTLTISINETIDRDEIIKKLIEMYYDRNNLDLKRGTFRVRGDIIEIIPINQRGKIVRIDLFGDVVETISMVDPITGAILSSQKNITIFPASHFVTSEAKLKKAIANIEEELEERLEVLKSENKLLEHQRLKERTRYDLEMLKETGFCSGVENYARHLALKKEGETPATLMDFFGDDYLLIIDESHVTVPQVRGMYNGDRARKTVLVEHGFRLPSALDNRPLTFQEFEKKMNKVVYVSATPGDYELQRVPYIIEQIIRPTGLIDPVVEVRGTKNQIDDIMNEIDKRIKVNERTLITTLTIRMAEELTNYLKKADYKVAYMHSEIKTLERIKIIRDLRLGKYDILVGINLLREGLDLPEVSLITIMDADKQGFLRSARSLIQTIGRAARNINGKVILYADKVSDAMKQAIEETDRRRQIQVDYNVKNNITPATIIKEIRDPISNYELLEKVEGKITKEEEIKIINNLEEEMKKAADNLDFERAMELRDALLEMKVKVWKKKDMYYNINRRMI